MAKREPEERADNVSISITEKLANFYHPSSECCIFRMYDDLRRQNEKAYEPSIIAIGPYHRGKAKLKQMEEHKLWYLQQLLNREKNKSVNEYIMAIKELEERARNCYAETIRLESDEFVEMMLLDSFFIIELFRKNMRRLTVENDHIFQSHKIRTALRRDLILLENQLPFFILVRLFNMTKTDLDLEIIQIALTFLQLNAPELKLEAPSGISINSIKHLLHLVHGCWCFKFAEMNRNATEKQLEFKFIGSATELQELGVQFQKSMERNLFDIKFISGILKIPILTIVGEVGESFFTNLVAFELCPSYQAPTYVCDYVIFINCLINSSEDVRLLRRSGIIESWERDDAKFYSLWNKLFDLTTAGTGNFSYSQVFNDVNSYCKRSKNVWMANLKRKYFNSPTSLISFLAATALLLLTVAQTIFSILSFGKGSFN